MSFVIKHLIGNDERLIGIARLHWIYLLKGFLMAAAVLLAAYGVDYLVRVFTGGQAFEDPVYCLGRMVGTHGAWFRTLFGALALALFAVYVIKALFTEVALTSKRVIYKTGFLAVEVHEMDLHEIDAANVYYGLLGAALGYGTVHLDCRFVGDVRLPAIRNPYRFLQALHKAKATLPLPDKAKPTPV